MGHLSREEVYDEGDIQNKVPKSVSCCCSEMEPLEG